MPADDRQIESILAFWFTELTPKDWWGGNQTLDGAIHTRYFTVYERLAQGVPEPWRATPRGALAAVLVLDQFPRNMFRNDARAFATDSLARATAHDAVARRFDRVLSPVQRQFMYMPFQHSEDARDQARSVELYTPLGEEFGLGFARAHKEIIDKFGRFPHRNAILGRESTEEELAFLAEHGRGY